MCTTGSSGTATFTNILQKGNYYLKATVLTALNTAITRRKVRLSLDSTACTAHLINRGVSIMGSGRARVEFTGVGPVTVFACSLNDDLISSNCKCVYY